MICELRDVRVGLDQAVREFQGMGGGEANPLDPLQGRHMMDQRRQVYDRPVCHRSRVSVDVLAQQRDFTHTLCGQLTHFFEH